MGLTQADIDAAEREMAVINTARTARENGLPYGFTRDAIKSRDEPVRPYKRRTLKNSAPSG